jgi:putative endonuclease
LLRCEHYVYILSNVSSTLYVGVTDDLPRRISQHRLDLGGDFTRRYHCHMLVSCERFNFANNAIAAEKKIKGWSRAKLAMALEVNPGRRDLAEEATKSEQPTAAIGVRGPSSLRASG